MTALRVATGFFFVVSGLLKVNDVSGFAHTIDGFALLPHPFLLPAAVLVSGVEILCGLCLVTGFAGRPGARSLAVLTLVFSGSIAVNLVRGNVVPCGCFGSFAPETIGTTVLVRDILLSGWLWLLARRA